MATREEDVRECALAGCHRVGLYDAIVDPESDAFLDRPCVELVVASMDACPIGPPYNDTLMTFKQAYRACLEDEGYRKIRVYLQRLCTENWKWRDWCRYHSRRARLSKSG